MAEELTEYLLNNNVKCNYIHSDVDTLERVKIMGCLLYTSNWGGFINKKVFFVHFTKNFELVKLDFE